MGTLLFSYGGFDHKNPQGSGSLALLLQVGHRATFIGAQVCSDVGFAGPGLSRCFAGVLEVAATVGHGY